MSNALSTGEVASMLGVSKTTVLNYERQGRLVPYYKLPSGQRKYRMSDVVNFKKSLVMQKEENNG